MKNFFETLKEFNWNVTYTFIEIGMEFVDYKYRIPPDDVRNYIMYLAEIDPEVANNVSVCLLDDNALKEYVKQNSESEKQLKKVSYEVEKRKWVTFVLQKAIDNFPANHTFEDLFALGDLWYDLGMPSIYPCVPSEQEYVKIKNVDAMIEAHKSWINNEIASLSMS